MIDGPSDIDLSTATKLKKVVFCFEDKCRWVSTTLRTITSNHKSLGHISLLAANINCDRADRVPPLKISITHDTWVEWSELDCLLARLCDSHSTQLRIQFGVPSFFNERRGRKIIERLLAEVTSRGIVDLAPGLIRREFGDSGAKSSGGVA